MLLFHTYLMFSDLTCQVYFYGNTPLGAANMFFSANKLSLATLNTTGEVHVHLELQWSAPTAILALNLVNKHIFVHNRVTNDVM